MSEDKKAAVAETAGGGDGAAAPKKKANAGRVKSKKTEWTEARCLKAAKRFTTVMDWQAGAPSSFKAATDRSWMKACTSHMTKGVSPIKTGKKAQPKAQTHKKSA